MHLWHADQVGAVFRGERGRGRCSYRALMLARVHGHTHTHTPSFFPLKITTTSYIDIV